MARPLTREEAEHLQRRHLAGEPWGAMLSDYGYSSAKNLKRGVRRALGTTARLVSQDREEQPDEEFAAQPQVFDAPEAANFVQLITAFNKYLGIEAKDDYGVDEITKRIATDKPIGLVEICDMHIGNRGVAYDLLLEDVQTWVKEPGLYVVDAGDTGDNVLPKSRGGHDGQLMRVRTQYKAIDLLYAMLAEKLLGVAASNHLWRTETAASIDKVAEICEKRGVPYLPNGGLIHLHVGEEHYTIGTWHLFTGESKINKGNAFRRAFDEANQPDVILLADAHDPYAETSWRGSKRSVRLRGGTYKTKDGFLRRYCGRAADPAATMPMAILFPDRHHVIGFDDYRDGLVTLRALRT